jgi:hypothetical protein
VGGIVSVLRIQICTTSPVTLITPPGESPTVDKQAVLACIAMVLLSMLEYIHFNGLSPGFNLWWVVLSLIIIAVSLVAGRPWLAPLLGAVEDTAYWVIHYLYTGQPPHPWSLDLGFVEIPYIVVYNVPVWPIILVLASIVLKPRRTVLVIG